MLYRGMVGIIAAFWLAVNLLGCLVADDPNPHIVSSTVAMSSLDIPDDLKHPPLIPPSIDAAPRKLSDDHCSLLTGPWITPLVTQDAKPHQINCVFLL